MKTTPRVAFPSMSVADICTNYSKRVRFLLNSAAISALIILGSVGLTMAQCGPTSTIYAQDNNQEGVMFDISAAVDVTVTGFSINLADPGPYNIEIYAKNGTHVGFENNSGSWTLVATVPGVIGFGPDIATPIPIGLVVPIALGTTTAFYITDTGTGNLLGYTTGFTTGAVMQNDGNISILGGTGIAYAFGFATPDRGPNITVNYQCCPAPTVAVTGNSCPSVNDGTVNISGNGTGPWSYSIYDISGLVSGPTAPANAPHTFSSLASGNYYVTSTDANGCVAAAAVTIAPAQSMVINLVVTDNTCFGGTGGAVTANISQGSSPYNVVWNDPFGAPMQSDANVTTSTITGLSAGNYSVNVTDGSGCLQTQGITITQPATGITLSFSNQNVSCFNGQDGQIEAQCSGVSPYVYDLNDVLGNPITSANDPVPHTFTDLAAGTYFVTVTDADGCQIVGNTTLTEPPAIYIETSIVPVLCHDGNTGEASIDLLQGGTPPFGTTTWSNFQTGNTVTGLTPGNYTATVIDNNGCTLTQNFVLDNPTAMNLSPRYLTDTCGQGLGAAYVVVSLGTPPYSFEWTIDPINEVSYLMDSVGVGFYEVVVTDLNGCDDTALVEVKDDIQIPEAAFTYRFLGETFIDMEVLFINNSVGSTQYAWRFGDGLGSNEDEPTHRFAHAGDYLVQLSASNGYCEDTAYQYVNIDPLETLYVPNAFTPGNNHKNDTFRPYGEGLDLESYDMKIYDKWGRLVWQTGSMGQVWDGTEMDSGNPVPVGIYTYQITFRDFADLDRNNVVGSVVVIRD